MRIFVFRGLDICCITHHTDKHSQSSLNTLTTTPTTQSHLQSPPPTFKMYFSKATIIAVSAFIAQGIATPTLIENRNTNITDCAAVRSDCQSGPDPNQSYCASISAQCCDNQDNACRTGEMANMATCSAEKAACYASANLPNPYAKREEQNCATVRSDCQSLPDANQAACAAKAAECCDTKDNACRTAPDANMSFCSSTKATCYTDANLPNPYAKRADADGEECAAVRSDCQSGPDANQAACASKAADCCQTKDNACRTAPDANMSSCSAKKSACFSAASLPDPYSN